MRFTQPVRIRRCRSKTGSNIQAARPDVNPGNELCSATPENRSQETRSRQAAKKKQPMEETSASWRNVARAPKAPEDWRSPKRFACARPDRRRASFWTAAVLCRFIDSGTACATTTCKSSFLEERRTRASQNGGAPPRRRYDRGEKCRLVARASCSLPWHFGNMSASIFNCGRGNSSRRSGDSGW